MEIEKIIDAVSVFADYIENFTEDNKELETANIKLKEAVFWLTYAIENNEEV